MNDITTVVKRLRKAGYLVKKGSSGHWKVYGDRGQLLTVIGTSRGSWHGIKNIYKQIEKAGITL
jgi:hypothetical protein